MLRTWLVAVCSLGAVFGGCVGLFGSDSDLCDDGMRLVDDEEAVKAAFEEAVRFVDPATAPAFRIDQAMTAPNDELHRRWSFDAAGGALALDAEKYTARFQGSWWSIDGEGERGHGRDHRPGGAMVGITQDLDPMEFGFSIVEGGYGHDASCTRFEGREAVVFEREAYGADMTMTVDAARPHLPRLATITSASGHAAMVSTVTYGPVTVTVDKALPRLPATVGFEMTYGKDQDTVRLTDTTQWVPLSEVRVELLDEEGGVSSALTLEDLSTQHVEALRFEDADANGYLNEGDRFFMTVDTRLRLHDLWADAPIDPIDDTMDEPLTTGGSSDQGKREEPGLDVKQVTGTREDAAGDVRWLNVTVSGGRHGEDLDLSRLVVKVTTATTLEQYRLAGPGTDGFTIGIVRDVDSSLDRHRLGWNDLVNIEFDLSEAGTLGPREKMVIELVPEVRDPAVIELKAPATFGADTFVVLG